MVLGLVCFCRYFLSLYPGAALVQRRGDQDPCEHHFAHVRARGGGSAAVSAFRARSATSVAGTTRVFTGGRGNSADAVVMAADAQVPLPRKHP